MNVQVAADILALPSVQALPIKRRFFALSYIHSQDGQKAIEEAGYKPSLKRGALQSSASGRAGRMLRDGKVALAVREGIDLKWRSLAMGPGEVLARIARIARFDQRKLEGVSDLSLLDDDTAEALQGVKRREEIDKNGRVTGRTTEVKIASKLSALETLAKYHRLLSVDSTVGDLGSVFAEAMDRAGRRDALRASAGGAVDAIVSHTQTHPEGLPSEVIDQFVEGAGP